MKLHFSLAITLLSIAPALAQESVTSLFDGKTTNGWQLINSKPGNWVVKDGLLVTKGEGGGWISTAKTYRDFTLTLEYKTTKGDNSGVFIRSPHTGDAAYTGMEIQLLDDDDDQYKNIKLYQYTGSVYGVIAAKRGSTRPPGSWNKIEITANGPKIVVRLNGTTIGDGRLDEHKDAEKTHPGLLRNEGYIGLQSHSDEVCFRNIGIKELKPE